MHCDLVIIIVTLDRMVFETLNFEVLTHRTLITIKHVSYYYSDSEKKINNHYPKVFAR